MSSWSYYNEIDEYAAAWLRNLIRAGYIAPGEVDTRSIEDVRPEDLRGFTQCHFFAGIGVWSFALRKAGWADTRPVWTGSCPCQPFSAAGKGSGFDDQRHLWPAFHHLIQECKPAIVLGEQVASKDADPWIDLVQADVEALGYGFGAIPFPSASVGAPHIRDRLYWVAHAEHGGLKAGQPTWRRTGAALPSSAAFWMAHSKQFCGGRKAESADHIGPQANRSADQRGGYRGASVRLADMHSNRCNQAGQCVTQAGSDGSAGDCAACGMADADSRGCWSSGFVGGLQEIHRGRENERMPAQSSGLLSSEPSPGPVNGFWADADWLFCRDGKWRPVEPGTFPLVAGPAGGMGRVRADWHTPAGKEGFGHRAGRLKGYGNAINAEAARVFIECVMEVGA